MNWLRRIAAKYLFDGQATGFCYQVPPQGKTVSKGWIYGGERGTRWHISFGVPENLEVRGRNE